MPKRNLCTVLLLVLLLVPVRRVVAGLTVAGGLVREFTLEPGEVVVEELEMANTGSEEYTVALYGKDYLTDREGVSFRLPGEHDRSNANWIAGLPRMVTLAGGEVRRVDLRIEVPEKNLHGTYWSVLMVEPRVEREGEREPGMEEHGLALQARYRQAVQIITHVGNPAERGIEPVRAALLSGAGGETSEDVLHLLRVELENTGEVGLNPLVWAEVYDRKGAKVFSTRKERDSLRLFPGMSRTYEVGLKGLGGGEEYEVLLLLREDRVHTWAVQYLLKTGGG